MPKEAADQHLDGMRRASGIHPTKGLFVGAAILAAAVLGNTSPAVAADLYAGKTLNVYIGFGPGGAAPIT